MRKICWFDTETTGLSAFKNDIIQLACIIEVDGVEKASKTFYMQPFDYASVEQGALDVHGISLETIKTFPKPKDTYKDILDFFGDYINKYNKTDKFYPAGFNTGFDIDFLKNFFKKNGDNYYGSWFNYKMVDPMQILHSMDARGLLTLPSYKLVDVCKHFKVPHTQAHDAMSDIRATKELTEFLYSCLTVDTELLENGYEQFCKGRGKTGQQNMDNRGGSRS